MKASLSLAASIVWQYQREAEDIGNDLRCWHAPSECYADAFGGLDVRLDAELTRVGWTYAEVCDAVKDRINGKWAYLHGF